MKPVKEKICKWWLIPCVSCFVTAGKIYYRGQPTDDTIRLAYARLNIMNRIGKWHYYWRFFRAIINGNIKNNPLEQEAERIK